MSANRDIGQEILDGIKSIKQGKGEKHLIEIPDDVVEIRQELHLSQSAFSALLRLKHKNFTGLGARQKISSRPGFITLKNSKSTS